MAVAPPPLLMARRDPRQHDRNTERERKGAGGGKHGGERGRDAAIRKKDGGYYLPSKATEYPGAPCFPGPGPRLRSRTRSEGRDEVGRRVDGLGGG